MRQSARSGRNDVACPAEFEEVNVRHFGIAAVVVVMLASSSSLAHAEERTVALSVQNATCAFCTPIIEWTLNLAAGVLSVTVTEDYLASPPVVANVVYDDAITDIDTLIAAIATVGFPATRLLPGDAQQPALKLGNVR